MVLYMDKIRQLISLIRWKCGEFMEESENQVLTSLNNRAILVSSDDPIQYIAVPVTTNG